LCRRKYEKCEGPFGDHFGHYSKPPISRLNINLITHKKNAIYPATVVGKPPMEDKFMGDYAVAANFIHAC